MRLPCGRLADLATAERSMRKHCCCAVLLELRIAARGRTHDVFWGMGPPIIRRSCSTSSAPPGCAFSSSMDVFDSWSAVDLSIKENSPNAEHAGRFTGSGPIGTRHQGQATVPPRSSEEPVRAPVLQGSKGPRRSEKVREGPRHPRPGSSSGLRLEGPVGQLQVGAQGKRRPVTGDCILQRGE